MQCPAHNCTVSVDWITACAGTTPNEWQTSALSAHLLFDPLIDQPGDLKVVLVHHHHVTVAGNAIVRQQQERRASTAAIDQVHRLLTAAAPLIAVHAVSAHAVVTPDRSERDRKSVV